MTHLTCCAVDVDGRRLARVSEASERVQGPSFASHERTRQAEPEREREVDERLREASRIGLSLLEQLADARAHIAELDRARGASEEQISSLLEDRWAPAVVRKG